MRVSGSRSAFDGPRSCCIGYAKGGARRLLPLLGIRDLRRVGLTGHVGHALRVVAVVGSQPTLGPVRTVTCVQSVVPASAPGSCLDRDHARYLLPRVTGDAAGSRRRFRRTLLLVAPRGRGDQGRTSETTAFHRQGTVNTVRPASLPRSGSTDVHRGPRKPPRLGHREAECTFGARALTCGLALRSREEEPKRPFPCSFRPTFCTRFQGCLPCSS